jgi:hypothetical protein
MMTAEPDAPATLDSAQTANGFPLVRVGGSPSKNGRGPG